MTDKLKSKAISGICWRGLETIGTQGIQFVVGIILARILAPEEFGLIAMLLIFTQLAQTFVESGFSNALIQKKNANYTDECSVFYFNLLIAMVVYAVLFVTAPFIASFYNEPQLIKVLRVISLTLVIGALGQIQQTLLTKQINFKSLLKVGVISIIISGTTGIIVAYKGFGVWAIVTQQLTLISIRTLILWLVSPWRPAWLFCIKSLKSLFRFGSKLLVSGLLDTFFNNIYGLIIGKFYTPTDLGYYNRGRSVPNLLMMSVNGTIATVMFPVFSELQDDHARLKTAAKRTLKKACFFVMPLMFGLVAVADTFIRILLTDKWLPCVPYLRVMCLVFSLFPVHVTNLQLINAIGRSDIFLRLEIIKKILIAIAIMLTLKHGIMAIVIGQLVTSVISVFLNTYYSGKLVGYSTTAQLKDTIPIVLLAAMMAVVVYYYGLYSTFNDYVKITMQVILGIVVYLAGGFIFKIDDVHAVIDLVKKHILFKLK